MAPRKKTTIVSETVEKPASSTKKRKQPIREDSNDSNESKEKPKRKKLSLPPSEPKNKVSTPEKTKTKEKPKPSVRKNNKKKTEVKVEESEKEEISVDDMNVEQLLALGENTKKMYDFSVDENDDEDDVDFQPSSEYSESSEDDFEEVKDADLLEPVIPKDGVDITLDVPNLYNKRKKRGFDLQAHLKRQINRVKKDLQLLIHKVHVLGWIAHIRFVNNTLNNSVLMENCASLIKSKNLYPSKYSDLSYLEGILKWFHKTIEFKKEEVDPSCKGGLFQELKYQIQKKQAFSPRAFIFMFIILLRVLGLKARIVMSFQVAPVKPTLIELFGDELKARSEKIRKANEEKAGVSGETSNSSETAVKSENVSTKPEEKSSQSKTNKKSNKKKDKENDSESESEHFKKTSSSSSKRKKEDLKKDLKSKKTKKSLKDLKSDEDEDSDFTEKSLIKKTETKKKTDKKSNIGGEGSQKKKEGSNVWTEVYLEAEEKWISVDVPRQKIHCIGEIYVRATHPVTYIVACNNDHTLKDVTKRYVPNWHSDTRKKRVDDEWWNETMKPYLPPKTAQDREEDEDINRQLLDKPLPSSIAEFKDHPLYALKRHLLKFEAIYPPDAPTLGFVRREPVYARECVHTLHSREMWYKQARVVRLGEEPYKTVKARPKYDKMTGEMRKDLPLELFGKWQTEDYIPPIATDGKVPRNEYGNVDLFKPCMLPIGTVHLQIPSLQKIAKKLDIDCAPATVGFEFHSGGSHPVFDGFVVCEEFKEVLLDAWNKEIDESSKREAEKKEKRVYGNWKRLIRGLLIREKLKIKYAFGEHSDEENESKPTSSKASASNSSKK